MFSRGHRSREGPKLTEHGGQGGARHGGRGGGNGEELGTPRNLRAHLLLKFVGTIFLLCGLGTFTCPSCKPELPPPLPSKPQVASDLQPACFHGQHSAAACLPWSEARTRHSRRGAQSRAPRFHLGLRPPPLPGPQEAGARTSGFRPSWGSTTCSWPCSRHTWETWTPSCIGFQPHTQRGRELEKSREAEVQAEQAPHSPLGIPRPPQPHTPQDARVPSPCRHP